MSGFNRGASYRPQCRACPRSRRSDQLLCLRCWALVPEDLQKKVYGLYQRNSVKQSFAYLQAAAAAVQAAGTALATLRSAAVAPVEGDAAEPEPSAGMDALLTASSLGTPEAMPIRSRTPAYVSERFMRKVALAQQAEQAEQGGAPAAPDFFEVGKTYIQYAPYTPPEEIEIFSCVAMAQHPAKNEPRAFGFAARALPGDDWYSAAMGPSQWAGGWTEYSPDIAAEIHGRTTTSQTDPSTSETGEGS